MMKRTFAAYLLCLCTLLLASCSSQLTPSKIAAIENDILQVHSQVTAAAENLDADGMFEYILDSEETTIQTGDVIQNRQQALSDVKKSMANSETIQYQFEQKNVTVLSPTRAEMDVIGKSINTTPNGRVRTFPFTQKILFVLTDDGWRIQHAQHIPENV
ncbi:MAG: nuclear transport factor 2 family protein [Planctomycetota bacterium]